MSGPLLQVEKLVKHYPLGGGIFKKVPPVVRAVEDVSFTVNAGETLCIVGESGCGKSTIARLLMRLVDPTGGRVLLEGNDIASLNKNELRDWRRRMQMVFQDPYSSLNPRLTAGQIITEPVENFERLNRRKREDLAAALLRKVGLSPEIMHRLPSELSGGAEPAARNCARVVAQTLNHHRRRGSVRSRRLRAGTNPQSPDGPPGGDGDRLRVHLARSWCCRAYRSSSSGHVSRADYRIGHLRSAVRQANPSLYRGAYSGRPYTRSHKGSVGGASRG